MSGCFLSVVIPVYNEEENIGELHGRLKAVCTEIGQEYEIIFVDDGCVDNSLKIIKELAAENPEVKCVVLSRNFGHQICLTAGLDHARGEVIVMMDADLQDPPEVIPELIAKYREGYDVVYAMRKSREGETIFKKLTAAVFYRTLRSMTNIDVPLDTGDFRLISRRALDSVLSIRERNRFLRGLFPWVGFKQTGIEYDRSARFAGETKFSLKRMVRFAIDGLTSFTTIPLQFATYIGFASAFLGFIYSIKVVVNWWNGSTVPGWASSTILILFFGGVQLITLGILGEYIGRIFDEVKNRPLYFTREKIGFQETGNDPTPPRTRV